MSKTIETGELSVDGENTKQRVFGESVNIPLSPSDKPQHDAPPPRYNESSRSLTNHAALVCMTIIIMLSMNASLMISKMASSSDRKSSNGAIAGPKGNLLGIYYVNIPKVSPSDPRTAVASLSSQSSEAFHEKDHPELVDEEAFFLRYYIMPLEEVPEAEAEAEERSNHTNASSNDVNALQFNLSGNASEGPEAAETPIKRTSKLRLMRPRARLLQTARALQKELEIAAREDFVKPFFRKWTQRFDAVTSRFQSDANNNAAALNSTMPRLQLMPIKKGGALPNAILGIFPFLPAKHNATNYPGATVLPKALTRRRHVERANPNKGKTSVCPTNLLCYFTIPPTSVKKDVICATYCRRCLETTAELREAIELYMADPTNHTSHVATTYGWPIRNWCTSHLTDFSYIFANKTLFKKEDISGWDLSSATTMRTMFGPKEPA